MRQLSLGISNIDFKAMMELEADKSSDEMKIYKDEEFGFEFIYPGSDARTD